MYVVTIHVLRPWLKIYFIGQNVFCLIFWHPMLVENLCDWVKFKGTKQIWLLLALDLCCQDSLKINFGIQNIIFKVFQPMLVENICHTEKNVLKLIEEKLKHFQPPKHKHPFSLVNYCSASISLIISIFREKLKKKK